MVLLVSLFVVWCMAAWTIRVWAEQWGKRPVPFFLTSLLLTPLLPAFVLLFQGPEAEIREALAISGGRAKLCLRCSEAIRAGAAKCRYCGSEQSHF